MSLSGAAVAQQEPATSAWPVLEVASPNPGAVVSTGDFVVTGSAFDPAATTGSGISRVDLFLGDRERGGLFLGSAIPGQDALQGLTPGSQAAADSFSVTVSMPTTLIGGSRDFHAYAYSSLTGNATDVSMPLYIGLAPTPMATPAAQPVLVANVEHMVPGTVPETFSLANLSAGDVVGTGDYVVSGAAGPTVDRVSLFLDERDTGGMLLGAGTPMNGQFTLTVKIPTSIAGGHMLLRGQRVTARADVLEDPVAVAAEVERLIARLGPKEASRQLYMGLDLTPPPTQEQLAQALHGVVVVRITPERAPMNIAAQPKKGDGICRTTC